MLAQLRALRAQGVRLAMLLTLCPPVGGLTGAWRRHPCATAVERAGGHFAAQHPQPADEGATALWLSPSSDHFACVSGPSTCAAGFHNVSGGGSIVKAAASGPRIRGKTSALTTTRRSRA